MKAIAKTRPSFGAEIVDIPVPRPGRAELLVKVASCGICGSDLHIYEWELGAERFAPRLPMVLGHEPAGVVVETGPDVTGFKKGDNVALDPFGHCGGCGACLAGRFNLCTAPTTLSGAFAEFTIAPVGNSHLVPSDMNLEQAALLEPFATGLHGVEQSCVKAGDSVVVEGPGPDWTVHGARRARDGRHLGGYQRPARRRRTVGTGAQLRLPDCLRARTRTGSGRSGTGWARTAPTWYLTRPG